jgi:hypothetical protein
VVDIDMDIDIDIDEDADIDSEIDDVFRHNRFPKRTPAKIIRKILIYLNPNLNPNRARTRTEPEPEHNYTNYYVASLMDFVKENSGFKTNIKSAGLFKEWNI